MSLFLATAAMAHMDQNSEGEGYFLRVSLVTGVVVTGAAYKPDLDLKLIRLDVPNSHTGERAPVWIALNSIVAVEIER